MRGGWVVKKRQKSVYVVIECPLKVPKPMFPQNNVTVNISQNSTVGAYLVVNHFKRCCLLVVGERVL